MISVKFSADRFQRQLCLSVNGHAGAAPAGHDLICSAATILVQTAAQTVCDMHGVGMLARPPTVILDSGNAEVKCRLKEPREYDGAVRDFRVIQTGFRLLSEKFPEYVELKEFGITRKG